MARSDPMTALLSPAVGGSMQSQMEAKLASMSLKSPGLKSNLPASPTARNFSGSAIGGSSFLSPESANNAGDAAATLAQQRAKLKASNAAHRISAPALSSTLGADRNTWGSGSNQLGQVDERSSSPAQEITIVPNPASRPKSTDFSGLANALKSPRGGDESDQLSPMPGGSWASMVNTPLIPIFKDTRNAGQSLDAAAQKLNDWSSSGGAAVPLISDPPKKFNRLSKSGQSTNDDEGSHSHHHNQGHSSGNQRNVSGNMRSMSNNGNLGAFGGQAGWGGARSPALSNTSTNRFSDDGSMNGLGMAGFGAMGMGNPGLAGLPGAGGFNMAALAAAGMAPVSPFNSMFNVSSLAAMGLTPEQMLAMQMAAAGQLGQLGQGGLSPFGMGMGNNGNMRGNRGMGSARSSTKSPLPRAGEKKDDEDVDPKLLEDVPAWLRSLRLHKYTPNFEGMSWRDMVVMDEAQLEAKGVAALGARRKMLKTFDIVRKKMGIEGPAGAALSA